MQVAALEVSTSSAKAMVFDLEDGVVQQEKEAFPSEIAGESTQEPEGIVQVAVRVLERVVADHKSEIQAVGLCGTWHSLLYTDEEGDPDGSIRTWVDTTGQEFVEQKRSDSQWVDAYYRKTGCLPHAMYPFWKHAYLQREGEFDGKPVRISSQVEYLFEQLTGERAVSRCMASGSGFMNIHTADWDESLLSFSSIEDETVFSPLVDETHTASLRSEVAEQVGLSSDTPVTVGAADGALNQLGVGGTRTDVVSFSVGTSGAIRMGVDDPELPHERSTWCYYLHDGTRIAGGATHGINCIDWFIQLLNSRAQQNPWDYTALARRAAECQSEEAPYFLPFLFGERAPGWNEDRTGTFAKLTSDHGPGSMYYAIQEGILFTLYDCYRMLINNWGASPEKIVISGGILNSDPWTQLASDLFGSELEHTGRTNDSTVGAAMLALVAAGGVEHVNEIPVPSETVATPSSTSNHERLQERYHTYRDIYSVNE